MVANHIAQEIISNKYFFKLFKLCLERSIAYTLDFDTKNQYSGKEYCDLLRFSDLLSLSTLPEARNYAYKIITYLNPFFNNDPYYCTVSKAVYSNLGNFPAVAYLETANGNTSELPFERLIEVEAKKIIQEVPNYEGTYFTDVQYELYSKLISSREFSFSGPTSMGKSFVIKAFIRKVIQNTPPENLVVLVPSRALINQFAIELKKELGSLLEQCKYRIATNSNITELPTNENNNYILILTPERLISYISQDKNPPLGFLFVDEAHKIAQSDDSRSITTYTSIEKTLKKYSNVKLYFSSPNVGNPEVLLNIFRNSSRGNHFKTTETTVAQNLYFIDLIDKKISYYLDGHFIKIENPTLDDISTVNEVLINFGKNSNLIYCNAKSKTIEYATIFAQSKSVNVDNKRLNKAASIIREYIHPDYYLSELIKKGVAYHFGNMPQLIRNLIEELYKNGDLNFVFCTSTLLEGVNMPTQNLFILDHKKSKKSLTTIDFWNLAGRAGRLARELQGNIFCIKHMGDNWDKVTFFENKEIQLTPAIFDKIDHNLKKIEAIIQNKDISGTESEKNILKYIANIICVDTLEAKTGYSSPIIDALIEKNKSKIIEIAKAKSEKYETPYAILSSNESIGLDSQDAAYRRLKYLHAQKRTITFPSQVNYNTCLDTLNTLYDLYKWENNNKYLSKKIV